MALTQMQTIQSLGEALAWLEREVSWGVKPTELGHFCGRTGELYACVVSGGQMALDVNQHGYDVVGASGKRISVKTTAVAGAFRATSIRGRCTTSTGSWFCASIRKKRRSKRSWTSRLRRRERG